MNVLLKIGGGEIGVRSQFRTTVFPEQNTANTKLGSDPNFFAFNFQQCRRSEKAAA
jgi:hypothetical protein